MFRFRFALLLVAVVALIAACDRPSVTTTDGALTFANDTLKFDSIFINFRTPSKRLIAHNNGDENLLVSRVWLDRGDSSEFKLIVNGIRSNDVRDVVVEAGDSIYLFVELTSVQPDTYVEEYVNFETGQGVQRVLLRAWVVDAILYRARVDSSGYLAAGSDIITENTVFSAEKPYVIDGPLFVISGVTLTVQPGAKLYFSAYKPKLLDGAGAYFYPLMSGIFVEGKLNAAGTAQAKVEMTGYRLEEDYREKPGEWRGIIIRMNSEGSTLEHCLIKNGARGVEVNDSISIYDNPRLWMRYCEVRNMSETGVYAWSKSSLLQNPNAIQMDNCLIHSCKENTVRVEGGGNYAFRNCTFANYAANDSFSFLREGAQLYVGNVYDYVAYPIGCTFTNCLIWGDKEDEISFGKFEGTPKEDFNLLFDHCLYRWSAKTEAEYVKSLSDVTRFFANGVRNQDPAFVSPNLFNFKVAASSPAAGAGKDLLGTGITDDFDRRPRTLPFDIGAYETE